MPSVLSNLDHDHGELRSLAIAAATAASSAEAEALSRSLGEALSAHFCTEEAPGGLFEWLERSPVPTRVVARLQRDHVTLRERLPPLLGALRARAPDAMGALHRFVGRFLQHEWLERTAAVRAALGPGPGAVSAATCEDDPELGALASELLRQVQALGGPIRQVELVMPGDQDQADRRAGRLEVCLADAGLEFVEVLAVPGDALRVLTVSFEPSA